MTITIKARPSDLADIIPPSNEVAAAAARGVEVLVKDHFRERNASRPANRFGLPKSNYWALAADATRAEGNVVEVTKEGVALHYFGGIVRPSKKALAIPVDPSVADVNPRESGMAFDLIWSKGNKTGFLKDPETGDLLWMLVPQAKIDADASVLPTDAEMLSAAEDAAADYMEATA